MQNRLSFDETQDLIAESDYLRQTGEVQLAYKKLLDAAKKGNVGVMVELALHARRDGNEAKSHEWIEKAEELRRQGSEDDHIWLKGAYSLLLGRGTLEEIQKKAKFHLEQVARLDNPYAQEDMAIQYMDGTNGFPRDEEKFEYWIQKAMDLGSPRAFYIYADYLFSMKKPIPDNLIEVLKETSSEKKIVKKLLAAIERREKRKHH